MLNRTRRFLSDSDLKVLDAEDKLSLQVHPPRKIAAKLDGEPKTECWYVADAEPNAEIFVGFRSQSARRRGQTVAASSSAAKDRCKIRRRTKNRMLVRCRC